MENNQEAQKGPEFAKFALPRVIIALILIFVVIAGLSVVLSLLRDEPKLAELSDSSPQAAALPESTAGTAPPAGGGHEPEGTQPHAAQPHTAAPPTASPHAAPESAPHGGEAAAPSHGTPAAPSAHETPRTHTVPAAPAPQQGPLTGHAPGQRPDGVAMPLGVAFVEAVMKPIKYEIEDRFWGWRVNDIINVTDNVNYFQLGVLEVTRRTAVQLAERISRTGSTASFNRHLENAMNGFMISADSYWFPSPESKYKESVRDLENYRLQLVTGKAPFYTRADNLIPLLAAYEDLLGSCDENLVKTKERDGSKVGFFSADNYFYYARGVASAMASILEAVAVDFSMLLENRRGEELLHHALISCQQAAAIDPWLIFNGDLDGILANHRANLAAPISHARFYLGQLVKTLST